MSPLLKEVLTHYQNSLSEFNPELESLFNSNDDIADTDLLIFYEELITNSIKHYFKAETKLLLRERIYLENLLDFSIIKGFLNQKKSIDEKPTNIEEFKSALDKINNSTNLNYDLASNELFYILFSNYNKSTINEWDKQLLDLSNKVFQIHKNERDNNILKGHIYSFNSEEEIIVIGDLHGDIFSLWQIFIAQKLYDLVNRKLIFLGDYIDRGTYQLSTLYLPLLLKKIYPNNVFLLKGNHENFTLDENGMYKANVSGDNDLFINFWKNYLSQYCIDNIVSLLNDLPILIQFNEKIGIVHGGLPRPTNGDRYDEINSLYDLDTEERNYEMIWNRPVDKEIAVMITGDSDFETSLPHFNNFIERLGWKFMIRGHCVDLKGYKLFYDNRMATIFSSGSFMAYSGYQGYRPVYANIKDNVFYIKKVYGDEVLETIDIEEI